LELAGKPFTPAENMTKLGGPKKGQSLELWVNPKLLEALTEAPGTEEWTQRRSRFFATSPHILFQGLMRPLILSAMTDNYLRLHILSVVKRYLWKPAFFRPVLTLSSISI